MIIIDKALQKLQEEGRPIRVGMIGAGFMARGIALQIFQSTPGMKLVAVYNRHVDAAKRLFIEAGCNSFAVVDTQFSLDQRISDGKFSIVDDPLLICLAENIDVVIEVTGAVEFSASVVYTAISNKKHVVMMNAELDATVGCILKKHADRNGVVLTNVDGDQPGVQMNLYRFVKTIGLKPVLCGNIKGLHDPYRNPTTQEGFARKWGQQPTMVTSFADGSKISFEQAIVANATGMSIAKRGMLGPVVPSGTHIKDIAREFPLDVLLRNNGIVDYVVGAEPGPGVFVLGTMEDPKQRHYLNLYKLGEGPLYLFYTPYHLCHFEVPITCARAVLFGDAAVSPIDAPTVEVVTTAKISLKPGEKIDGIGGYMTYGLCETAHVTAVDNLLPMGLAENCIVKKYVEKDQVLTYDDVILPIARFSDKLRKEQNEWFVKASIAGERALAVETV